MSITNKPQTRADPNGDVTPQETENRRLARTAATEGIVLLENDGALPLAPCSVALYGAGAAATIKGGTGSGEVNERYAVTIMQGLINAGFTITTKKWLKSYDVLLNERQADYRRSFIKKVLRTSADERINFMADGFQYPFGDPITPEDTSTGGDACIYVVARQAGESSDRKLDRHEYDLSPIEIDHLKTVAAAYPKTILVINSGASMDISPVTEIAGINAVIYFCQQGMEGGNALADIITGAVSPSGCLSSTWPKKYADIPNAMEYSYLKGRVDVEEYKEGIYVGYRYFDSFGVEPRYEFGYGKSYAEFSLDILEIKAEGSAIAASIKVTNIGQNHTGKRTIQIYASSPSGILRRERQSLAAFGKTAALAPGRSQIVDIGFDLSVLAGYDEARACYMLERGDYVIRVGESSRNTRVAAVVSLDETAVVEECRNICKPERLIDEIAPAVAATATDVDIPDDAARIFINASDISTKKHNYDPPQMPRDVKTGEVLEQLGTKDMLKVVLGTGMFDSKPFFKVPGAAAHTTSHLVRLGVPDVALCDGPAGLRLQRISVRKKSGSIKPVDSAMRLHDNIPKVVKLFTHGSEKRGTPLYQYATAFPVGTALAQTWNAELAEQVGKAIGSEMARFGVTFWLAPGMNIQRNPLCGRNFEYFSEDPLLTGKTAAAIIRGIQSHDGCYATIKHYAANNQETNRNKSDSAMSERTLREIYLKGFRIAVEEGGAKALMTSYNKLNGVYTPNSYDLCTNALRCEWGFDGVVMTDWLSTGEGLASNGLAIKAGNDLIMPGGRAFYKMLKEDFDKGVFSELDLRLSAARVLAAVLNK